MHMSSFLQKVFKIGLNSLISNVLIMFFYKRYVCKHLVGIAIIQKKIITRPAAKNQPLGIKRGKGRPPMAKLALVRMMHESILDFKETLKFSSDFIKPK